MITYQQLLESLSTVPKVSYTQVDKSRDTGEYIFVCGYRVYSVIVQRDHNPKHSDRTRFYIDFGIHAGTFTPQEIASVTKYDLVHLLGKPLDFSSSAMQNPALVLAGVIHGIKTILRAFDAQEGNEVVGLAVERKTAFYRALGNSFINRGWMAEVPRETDYARKHTVVYKITQKGAETL